MSIEVTVKLSEYMDEGSLEDRIIENAASQLVENMLKTSKGKLDALVEQLVESEVRESLVAETASILENGWQIPGDSYSRRAAKTQTVHGVIVDAVKALEARDRYGNVSISALVHESLSKQFSQVMADGIKEIKAKLDKVVNETIDETITGEIKTKIRSALAR